MKVLFLSYIPSPYRVAFFNELGKLCDLTVLFEKASSKTRDDSWKNFQFKHFTGVVLDGKGNPDIIPRFSVTSYLNPAQYDEIVVHNLSTPTGIWAIRHMKAHHIPYSLEGDGAFPKTGRDLLKPLKTYLIKDAKTYFSTAEMNDAYFLQYGADESRIRRYPFSSLLNEDVLENVPSQAQKEELRRELGITGKYVLLTVGQMIHRKAVDVLLYACEGMPADVDVFIIGGKPQQEYLDIIEKLGLTNIHFIDFLTKTELKKYYMAADLFVIPTREDIWGLVVNEAMACGLPIVSSDRCVASLELIKNGLNGYIVPSENPQALRNRIDAVLHSAELRKQMAASSLETIRPYTVENMAMRHIEIWEKENDCHV